MQILLSPTTTQLCVDDEQQIKSTGNREERRGEGRRTPLYTDLGEMMSSILTLTRDEEHMT